MTKHIAMMLVWVLALEVASEGVSAREDREVVDTASWPFISTKVRPTLLAEADREIAVADACSEASSVGVRCGSERGYSATSGGQDRIVYVHDGIVQGLDGRIGCEVRLIGERGKGVSGGIVEISDMLMVAQSKGLAAVVRKAAVMLRNGLGEEYDSNALQAIRVRIYRDRFVVVFTARAGALAGETRVIDVKR